MIGIVLGSPHTVVRRMLATELGRLREVEVVGEAGAPEPLHRLVAIRRPALVVLEAGWGRACPNLIGRLLDGPAPPRVLLFADNLAAPEVLAAVTQGVHGCLARDAAPATWRRAILAVHAGECWIPRALMAAALVHLKQLLAKAPALSELEPLTDRQREIVRWVAQGLSNKEIGRHLGISPTTVKTHLHNIFEWAGVSGRQHLVVRALHADAPRHSDAAR